MPRSVRDRFKTLLAISFMVSRDPRLRPGAILAESLWQLTLAREGHCLNALYGAVICHEAEGYSMDERRQDVRNRTYLGGRLSFNRQFSTFDCVVRNLSERGAMIQLDHVSARPDHIELNIAQRRRRFKAHVIWRHLGAAGLRFSESSVTDRVVPIDLARLMRKAEDVVSDLCGNLNRAVLV